MEASEPKWVNSILNIIEANSLRLEGLHILYKNESLPITNPWCIFLSNWELSDKNNLNKRTEDKNFIL